MSRFFLRAVRKSFGDPVVFLNESYSRSAEGLENLIHPLRMSIIEFSYLSVAKNLPPQTPRLCTLLRYVSFFEQSELETKTYTFERICGDYVLKLRVSASFWIFD